MRRFHSSGFRDEMILILIVVCLFIAIALGVLLFIGNTATARFQPPATKSAVQFLTESDF